MPDRDNYELYYQQKLWSLMPGIFRSADSPVLDQPGPLREIVNRIGSQAAVLRRSIDRLWEDQSIETCDDWVISYIADLLTTNLVASLDARGQRLDVAKTIYYRRRKGTIAVLEEIAADITGWDARVVEFFRKLGRTRHDLDPAVGPLLGIEFPDKLQKAQVLIGTHTHTAIGGFVDLRDCYGGSRAHSAFDELFHFADFRHGSGKVGWYNIPRLGVFLWRLISFGVDQTTPVAKTGCPGHFTFDPTGREMPLFAAASRRESKQFGDRWVSPDEWQLPTPIDTLLLNTYMQQLYPLSLGVFHKPGADYVPVPPGSITVYPELGRFQISGADAVFSTYHYGFSSRIGAGPYDRRVRGIEATPTPAPEIHVSPAGTVAPAATGTTTIDDSLTYTSVTDVAGVNDVTVRARNERRPLIRLVPPAEWSFTGSQNAQLFLDGLFLSGGDLVLRGEFESVTLRGVTFDPGQPGDAPNVFSKSTDDRDLVPTCIWVEGRVQHLLVERSITGPIRSRHGGILEDLQISDSILQSIRTSGFGELTAPDIKDSTRFAIKLRDARDPLSQHINGTFPSPLQQTLAAYDGKQPPSAQLIGSVVTQLNNLIGGPNLYTPQRFAGIVLSAETTALLATNPSGPDLTRLNRLLLEDAYPLELADAAIALSDGDVSLRRVTVLGRGWIHHLDASGSILNDVFTIEDPQNGCVRFSAWSAGSTLPRKYESVQIPVRAPVFNSRTFGQPVYCQLLETADQCVIDPLGGSILVGGEDGSEMGSFALDKNKIKEQSLLTKYEEYMPLGLVPVVIYVT